MVKLFGRYKQRRRSASMELSVNAIVILVMAMAVLGIGLGLIRGVLNSGKEKLTKSLDGMDLTEDATAERPITNINNIELKKNKDNEMVIGFYNKETNCVGGFSFGLSCNGINATDLSVDPITIKVNEGEFKKLGAIVTPTASSGSYGCSINIMCGTTPVTSESAFVKITT
ncbi:MAG: hypothetical protein PHU51_01910 [Candidatus Nanoarchaeia archaeon]|nr:hypothetical protein [Candidatus Nanoarchaeia archaeon]